MNAINAGKALIVDDDESNREYLQRLLEALNYETILAGGGQEGIALFKSE